MPRIRPESVLHAWERVEQFETHGRGHRPVEKAARAQFATPRALARALVQPVVDAQRVLDPAVGGGALLVAWAEANVGQPVERLDALHGMDADPAAIAVASEVLAILRGAPVPSAPASLWCGDALLEAIAPPMVRAPFDAVISNPPWVSYSGRHAATIDRERSELLAAAYPSYQGWPSLHGPFTELAARRLAPDGTLCILLPAAVATGERYRATRRAVTTRIRLRGAVTPVDERAFGGVLQPAILMVGDRVGELGRGSEAVWPSARQRGSEPDTAWVERVSRLPKVPARVFGDVGVHTGNASRTLLLDAPCAHAVAIREGRDVHSGRLQAPSRWLRTDVVPVARGAQGPRFRLGDLSRFASVPIVLRQTASRPIAALHAPAAPFRNSVLACFGLDGVPHALTVAWLNSAVVGTWFMQTSADAMQRTFPQIKVRALRGIPLPIGGVAALSQLAPVLASDGLAAMDDAIAVAYGLSPRERCSLAVESPGPKGTA